ncbi:AraC-like DNA-binding protein/quercetin dioxygenase-like cupin family protein [Paenibacillus phyllosphaerae]|uniref:AraC-like DNA-binding protein/quercetin dioxygenase-like cupin family protein n=1 Tax=Paenibacillus phyllosphaerae TaxID=274593 RepID=A0A7W5FM93_9BACL|nr:AraC family transcriptional regulator [Paenibacillus phyllosphaerae]MBB3109769.1 AraC-like DNA-binding protein/quercetin dioxygenase-like cupin family protein [Paenibacillus phyllosphaerae]
MAKLFAFEPMTEKPDAIDLLGIRFRWGGFGFRVLRCHLTSFPPGKVIRFHKHSEYEFHFIPRGKGSVILDGTTHQLQEGSFYLTGPGVLHQQEADVNEAMDELCLHVEIVPLLESADSEWGADWEHQEALACVNGLNALPLKPLIDQYNAMNWFLVAYRALRDNQPGAYTTIKQAIIQIMQRAARTADMPSTPYPMPTSSLNEHRFKLAIQFIHDNYCSALSLPEVAERIPISSRQLQRIFREQGAGSFTTYLESYRLTQICHAMMQGQGPLEQLALEHGFASASYFYAVFKKRFGMTPTQFKSLQMVQ